MSEGRHQCRQALSNLAHGAMCQPVTARFAASALSHLKMQKEFAHASQTWGAAPRWSLVIFIAFRERTIVVEHRYFVGFIGHGA